MFDNYDDHAKSVVSFARDQARTFNHNYIGTEHILLGLIQEAKSPAAKALEAAGATGVRIVDFIDVEIGYGAQPFEDHIPFTPRAKYVLERACVIALDSGVGSVAPLHILLALIQAADGYGFKSLVYSGVNIDQLRRDAVTRSLVEKRQLLQVALEKSQANVELLKSHLTVALDARDQAVESGDPDPVLQDRVDELVQLLLDAESLNDLIAEMVPKL